ncbi:hypothetical protein EII12_04880 [Buchananella hordeovulneris]|uniref:hypothetical protein n=1 Tax=Buchananella hordeovulneris TaxID=52770 RepID=UPI000F5FA337|nr:hypothetical protein [Buchananella hordeovulneris]RRD52510.1 hypothetical protein EII12_04880 [Buchananella hordeovulneris]
MTKRSNPLFVLAPGATATVLVSGIVLGLAALVLSSIGYGVLRANELGLTLNGQPIDSWPTFLGQIGGFSLRLVSSTVVIVSGIYSIVVAGSWLRVWVSAGGTRMEAARAFLVAIVTATLSAVALDLLAHFLSPLTVREGLGGSGIIGFAFEADRVGDSVEIATRYGPLGNVIFATALVVPGVMLLGGVIGLLYQRFHPALATMLLFGSANLALLVGSLLVHSGVLLEALVAVGAALLLACGLLLLKDINLAKRPA